MSIDEIIEQAIQGHASTREAIRWAMQQEREACAKLVMPLDESLADEIRARADVHAIDMFEKHVHESDKYRHEEKSHD